MSRRVGIVVIGRNEGARLVDCLRSVIGSGHVVYVDSGSSDESVARACELGATVVELDMSKPFTAARARNTGFKRLREIEPGVEFVQFVDGDCEIDPGWLRAADELLEREDGVAIVCGRLRERFPERSVFNRLASMEWDGPVGDVRSCGGVFLIRARAFDCVEGFRDDVIAGEEPELCSRILLEGWRVHRLPDPMASHDIAMTRFSQWWRRQVRAGYGGLYTFERCSGQSIRPFENQVRSARFWVLGWPLAVGVAALAGAGVDGVRGGAVGASIAAAALPAQVLRTALRKARRSACIADAMVYALFVTLAKVPQLIGQLRWVTERRRGVAATIIEHK